MDKVGINIHAILPEIITAVVAILIMLFDAISRQMHRRAPRANTARAMTSGEI